MNASTLREIVEENCLFVPRCTKKVQKCNGHLDQKSVIISIRMLTCKSEVHNIELLVI